MEKQMQQPLLEEQPRPFPDQLSKEIGSRTSLLDVLALYPIFDTLCSHLDIGGLLTLKKLSKRLSGHLATHSKERWNVNRRLRRFVRDPIRFRSQMARHNALISGSFVIQFLDDVLWEESDLDIYIENGEASLAFSEYLYGVEGYRAIKTEEEEYAEFEIIKVYRPAQSFHSSQLIFVI
jgi:hypothetical protein